MDKNTYQELLKITTQYNDRISGINTQAIKVFQNEEVQKSLESLSKTMKEIVPKLNKSLINAAGILSTTDLKTDYATRQIAFSLQSISEQYSKMLREYEITAISKSTRLALEQFQLSSIAQLCMSNETPMIRDTIACFANAKYEYLPNVINQAMERPVIGAADVAFIKNGSMIPVIEEELRYPFGFKTALKNLKRETAQDISTNSDIAYDIRENHFTNAESKIDSRCMNVVCSGIEVFGSGELFSEVELMDFISFLSRTPMGAGFHETGEKIHRWIRDLYSNGINIMSFDHDLYYHCRSRQAEDQPFTFDEMLRAPYGIPSAGRFNQVGRSHFYFANTRKGAEVEVKKHLKKDEVVQTVRLKPKKGIVILDLSGTLQRGATFLKMIRYPLKDLNNQMPKQYLLPCYVADCCKLVGIEGIKYYGSKEYDNYVTWTDSYFDDAGMCN